jgi:iron complex transport system substrate-binding protein
MRLKFLAFALAWICAADATPAAAGPPERIVSIGGDLTEIIFSLGAGDRVIAVDTTSLYPAAVHDLPKVGYMRALSAEGVLSLKPDLIVASEKAGPPAALDHIKNGGVPFLLLTEEVGPEGMKKRVTAIAAALGRTDAGERLVAEVSTTLDRLSAEIAKRPERPKVLFLLTPGARGTPLAAGLKTTVAEMIALAGARSAVTAYEGYKPLTPEAAVAADPDFLLLASHTVENAGGSAKVLAMPQLALTSAAKAGRLVQIDGALLLGFGPRTPRAILTLFRAFHGDAAISPELAKSIDP